MALNRKNALSGGHGEGAVAWGRVACPIEMAKINGVETYADLKVMLKAIAVGDCASEIGRLMLWSRTTGLS